MDNTLKLTKDQEADRYIDNLKVGTFHEWTSYDVREAFIAGMRAGPSVEMPPLIKVVMDRHDHGYNMGLRESRIALSTAGIKYTVKR